MATAITDTMMRPAQIDYKLRQVTAPRYKYMRIPLNNFPSASTPIGATASVMLEWKLPARVYNLARSYINYNMNAPVSGTAHHITYEDIFELGNSITFGSAGGVDLVNLQHLQNYTKIARKIGTPLVDFMGNDNLCGLYKYNGTNSGNLAPGGTGAAGTTFITTDSYAESQYSFIGASAAMLDRWRQYPLGAFYGTLLGVDRDFYSPVEQYLRVNAGVGNKMAFTCPTLGIATFANPVATPSLTINQVYLYLCVEQNQDIIDQIMQSVNAGSMKYRIPYTTAFRNLGGSANAQTNIQIQLSQQYGKRLKRILHTVFNPVEQLSTAYDTNNMNGLKILKYQSFLDSMPIQDRELSCLSPATLSVNADDWAENRKYLDKRSCIVSREQYALNWFHIDSWYEPLDKESSLPDVNKDEGLEMNSVKQWQFSATAGATAGLIHYTYAEFMREILITPAGPIFI